MMADIPTFCNFLLFSSKKKRGGGFPIARLLGWLEPSFFVAGFMWKVWLLSRIMLSGCISKPHLFLGRVFSQMKERHFPFGSVLSSYPYCFGIERNQLENCKKPDNAAIFCCPVLILLHKWLWRDSWILILPSALVLHVTHPQLPSMASYSPLLLEGGGGN